MIAELDKIFQRRKLLTAMWLPSLCLFVWSLEENDPLCSESQIKDQLWDVPEKMWRTSWGVVAYLGCLGFPIRVVLCLGLITTAPVHVGCETEAFLCVQSARHSCVSLSALFFLRGFVFCVVWPPGRWSHLYGKELSLKNIMYPIWKTKQKEEKKRKKERN